MTDKRDSQVTPGRSTVICSSDVLSVGGLGFCFEVANEDGIWPAFVVRHSKGIAAYINRCAHLALELDWDRGHFFDVEQRHIICATHGARYTADTGECVSGPCNGTGLEALGVVEIKGTIFLIDPRYGERCPEVKAGEMPRVTDG